MRRIFGMVLLVAAIGTLNASHAHAQGAFGFGVGGPRGFGYPYSYPYGYGALFGGVPVYGYAPPLVAPNVTYFQPGFYRPYVAVPGMGGYGYPYAYGAPPRYGYGYAPRPDGYGGPRPYGRPVYVR